MSLGLKQKFTMLAILSGIVAAIIAGVGYYVSYKNLSATIEGEMNTVIAAEGRELEGWLKEKGVSAQYLANLLSGIGDLEQMKNRNLLGLATSDKEILEVTLGLRDKFFAGYNAGDFTGKIDPTQRPWYQQAASRDSVTFTETYLDSFTNKMIISAVAPIKSNGQLMGATCVDVALDVLDKQIETMKYRGSGDGLIIAPDGNVLAADAAYTNLGIKTVQDLPSLAPHFQTMLDKKAGYFDIAKGSNGKERLFVYTTLETTGWIMGIAVDYDFVFASVNSLRFTYMIIAIGAFIFMFVVFNKMSGSITAPIIKLHESASELAKGNLGIDEIKVETQDEIGALATAFNEMAKGLRNLIGKMSNTSHQVAAASEQLTASATQSADTSVHIAERVNEVSANVSSQLDDINAAKENVDVVFGDIEKMSEKTKLVTKSTNDTADAAQRGSELMGVAVQKMANIEKSVMSSADVVKKLGESSQQIGQIVEAISAIAEQTNLLALNAAIEAARAGEHGRGFAVVSEEVRKLATESQTSADKIRERITAIQNDTASAVEAMEAGTVDVKEGTDAIREVGEQFQRIMKQVDGIQQQMEGIGTSMKTVSDGASHIVDAVESINKVSQKTSEHTNSISNATETQSASNEEIAAASQSLAQLAIEMQEAIGKFKM